MIAYYINYASTTANSNIYHAAKQILKLAELRKRNYSYSSKSEQQQP